MTGKRATIRRRALDKVMLNHERRQSLSPQGLRSLVGLLNVMVSDLEAAERRIQQLERDTNPHRDH